MASIHTDLVTNLKAYYPLTENELVRYDVHNNYHLSDLNTVTGDTGLRTNRGALFTATNSEYLNNTNTAMSVSGDHSFSCWVKFNSLPTSGNFQQIFICWQKDATYQVMFWADIQNASGTYKLRAGTQDSVSPIHEVTWSGVATGVWYNIVVTYKYNTATSGFKLYCNNVLFGQLGTGTLSTDRGSQNGQLNLGRYIDSNGNVLSRYFNGVMSDFGYWNTELSEANVTTLYNGGIGIPYNDNMLVKVGTYTGNGATTGNTALVTNLGFKPRFVAVWSSDAVSTSSPVFNFESALIGLGASMGYFGENGWITTTATEDVFASFEYNGFTVDNGTTNKYLNKNAVTFHYLALGGAETYSGTYAGNATDNRSIAHPGFRPQFVFEMGGTQHSVMKFLSSGELTDTYAYTYNASNASNGIQKLQQYGFEVGTWAGSNSSSYTYYYLALKASPTMYTNEYTGNNTDNTDITGLGFTPNFVWIKGEGAQNWGLASSTMTAGDSKYYRSSGFATNYIQSLGSGQFQIGNNADINTSAVVYPYIAFTETRVANTILPDNTTYAQALNTTSITQAHICSGSNRYLFVTTGGQNGGATGVTYNGVSLTQIGTALNPYTGYYITSWYLVNPASGSNNIVATYATAGSVWHYFEAQSFAGVDQSSPHVTTGESNTSGTTATPSFTTTADNQWGVYGMVGRNTATFGELVRSIEMQDNTENSLYRSSGNLPNGSTNMSTVLTSSVNFAYQYAILKPISTTTFIPRTVFFM